jgi:FMN phosphatase YigB (HAD superfamily)
MIASTQVAALLFDLGGVVIEIDFRRVFRKLGELSRVSPDEMRRRFKMDGAYRRHERGEIGAAEYFDHLRVTLELEGSDEEIAAGWNSIFVGEIPAALDCIRVASKRLPCYAFTNSNPTHRAAWAAAFPETVTAFERVFVSSDLGLRKPERAAFNAISLGIGVAPSSIMFFDDTQENVRGARAAGMQAVHIRDPADIERALREIGVL